MDISEIRTYQAGVAQSSAYRNLNKLYSAMLKPHGLTSMQWFVLGTISDSDAAGIQLTQLSAKLQTGLPFITNTINLLESKGMVERKGSPTDSRSKHVSITEDFKQECMEIEADLRAKLRKTILAEIAPEELNIYLKVLNQLSELKVDAPDPPDTP
ncbi:MAG TPA: MarR family transcriptional regulator [Candidatus Saccharimonadales bacterium]|jgi:DNA-binding MarR family transcriptional regulator